MLRLTLGTFDHMEYKPLYYTLTPSAERRYYIYDEAQLEEGTSEVTAWFDVQMSSHQYWRYDSQLPLGEDDWLVATLRGKQCSMDSTGVNCSGFHIDTHPVDEQRCKLLILRLGFSFDLNLTSDCETEVCRPLHVWHKQNSQVFKYQDVDEYVPWPQATILRHSPTEWSFIAESFHPSFNSFWFSVS